MAISCFKLSIDVEIVVTKRRDRKINFSSRGLMDWGNGKIGPSISILSLISTPIIFVDKSTNILVRTL